MTRPDARREAVRAALEAQPWARAVPVTDEMVDATLAELDEEDERNPRS